MTMVGNRIGQVLVETYRIERLIAEGGMGSVYEARHLRLPKRFAVKFLNLNLVNNTEAQARFRREAEIITALDHPNIVGLLDYNVTDEGVPFIVLEYLDGEHLGKRMERGRVPLDETLRILGPVVKALAAAHERGIVHRDLKPENIVLVRGGEDVKVVDFGVAKIRDGQELTAHNMIIGTIMYMAPEQLFGAAVDPRTDQFALATIVYEMLSGETAFGGPHSVPEVAALVANHQPKYVSGVPNAVNEVVLQAMAKAADARFPSVSAFYDALLAAVSKPDEAVVYLGEADEGLPPLAGEATIVSVAPSAPAPERRRAALAPGPATPVIGPDVRERQGLGDETGSQPALAAAAPAAARFEPARYGTDMRAAATMQLDRSAIRLSLPQRDGLRETAKVSAPGMAAPGPASRSAATLSAGTSSKIWVWIVLAVAAATAVAGLWGLLRAPL